ncbi:breast cancer anti-estrogen resistance protein 3 homolog isoform X2 [Liolophura sinensis]|uniref:breast cancer anti-estrogen resistance protein 3 homolog isoform X2 n=1 Tax=Liolophura sinensis TaxID=3198878 RepID=UPI003158A8C1
MVTLERVICRQPPLTHITMKRVSAKMTLCYDEMKSISDDYANLFSEDVFICHVRGKRQRSGKRGQGQVPSSPSPPSQLPTSSGLQRSQSAHAAAPYGSIYQDCNALTASPEKMQQDLQTELRGDSNELSSHIWYHGNIPRQRAEKLVESKGDYLVRDCVSQPGNFVLTCNWMGVALHFIINAKVVNPAAGGPPRVFYQFEDVSCQSVPDLLQYYRDMAKPVTESSGVIITNPIGRSMPLSYYDTKYGATANLSAKLGLQGTHTPSQSPKPSPFASPNRSPKLRRTPHRTGSQPLLSVDRGNKARSPSPLADQFGSLPSINNAPPPCPKTQGVLSPVVGFHHRSGSEPLLTPTNEHVTFSYEADFEEKMTPASSDSSLNKAPPPKPSRVPSVKYVKKPKVQLRNKKLYEDEEDRDYTDYDTIKSKPSWLKSYLGETEGAKRQLQAGDLTQVTMNTSHGDQNIYDNNVVKGHTEPIYEALQDNSEKYKRQNGTKSSQMQNGNSDSTNKNDDKGGFQETFYDVDFLRNRVIHLPKPDNEPGFNVDSFTTSLLPQENRPLEASGMVKVKTLLLECNAKILARHLTQVDLEVSKVIGEDDLGLGVQSGLELLTLPQGRQLRQDLMERCRCMHMFVATMILTCSGILERARMLSQWINIAMELRTSMGNLFGFTAVMEGLMADEIQRLRDTWMILRQNHTSSAFLFDTKLKTFHKTLTDANGALPVQNICIPNVASYISLMERDSNNIMDMLPWESVDDEAGLDAFLSHLEMGREISSQFNTYRAMGQAVLKDFREDRELRDTFMTAFHLRLLWGSRGAGVNRPDRYNKYKQLMMVLSERAEKPDDVGTEL